MSIGVAESLGYVVLDHSKEGTINDLPIFAAPDAETGEIRKYRNVREGTIDDPKDTDLSLSTKKIGNALRDKLQEIKQNSAEASLKAQIEAKKKELNTNKI